MNAEAAIRSSRWWLAAAATQDRHRPDETHFSVADHLEAVRANLACQATISFPAQRQLELPTPGGCRGDLAVALVARGLAPAEVLAVLTPVALLHDIGKPAGDKEATMKHPLTGRPVAKRHPVIGLAAGLEILPEFFPGRDMILALVEEHDTPYAWYRQFRAADQLPGRKGWGRLDEKIAGKRDGTGLALLAVFKMADIDGHEDAADVSWFIGQANAAYLAPLGRMLPVPAEADLRVLAEGG